MFDLSQFSLNGKVAVVSGGGRGIEKEQAGVDEDAFEFRLVAV